MKKIALLVVACIMLAGFGNYGPVQAYRYHAHIAVEDVQRIEVFHSFAPEFWRVPERDLPTLIRWFNEAAFQGDNDDLAGPGCTPVHLTIHLRSGQRVGVSIRGDEMHVSQHNKHYFLNQDQLEQYIRDHLTQGAGC